MIWWRIGGIAALLAAIWAGVWYVDSIRTENRAQAARIQALEGEKRITKAQQEASDRVQIELDDLREKSRARAAGLDRDLAGWLRNGPGCVPAATGPAASAPSPGAESPASAAAARSDGLAVICAAAAAESDDRADTLAAWQRWYEEVRRARAGK